MVLYNVAVMFSLVLFFIGLGLGVYLSSIFERA